jgi:hypothetical protein
MIFKREKRGWPSWEPWKPVARVVTGTHGWSRGLFVTVCLDRAEAGTGGLGGLGGWSTRHDGLPVSTTKTGYRVCFTGVIACM